MARAKYEKVKAGKTRSSRIALWAITAAVALGVSFGAWPAIKAVASPAARTSAQPASFSASTCGPWSAEGTATANAITSKHGPVRNCMRVGSSWVIATSGGRNVAGAIGVLSCAGSTGCLDGWNNPGVSRMHWLKPAGLTGGATVLGVDGTNLIIDYAGHQLTLNVVTDRFASSGK